MTGENPVTNKVKVKEYFGDLTALTIFLVSHVVGARSTQRKTNEGRQQATAMSTLVLTLLSSNSNLVSVILCS